MKKSDVKGNKILQRGMRRSSLPFSDSVGIMEKSYSKARKLGRKAEKKEYRAAMMYNRYKKYFEKNDMKMTPEVEEQAQKIYDIVMEKHNMRLLLDEKIK